MLYEHRYNRNDMLLYSNPTSYCIKCLLKIDKKSKCNLLLKGGGEGGILERVEQATHKQKKHSTGKMIRRAM